MAYREGSYSRDIHSVFIETNLGTRLTLPVQKDEIIIDFREKLCKVHKQIFPEIGEINVSALKVKRRGEFFYFTDFVNVFSTFAGISKSWYMYVDAVRVDKCEPLRLTAADQNLELVERKEGISIDSVLVDGNTKILSLEEGLETSGVAEKISRKRKLKSPDVETSRKKSSIALNQSSVASGNGVVTTREKGHDILMGAIGKDIVSEQKNDISMEGNQQTSNADRQYQKEILETDLAMGKPNEFDESRKSCEKAPVEKLDDLTEQGLENGGKTAELVKSDQEKDTSPTLELLATSIDDKNESNMVYGDVQVGVASIIPPIGKNNEGGEPSAAKNQTDEVVTYSGNQIEASSGLTTGPVTEKKRKRTKSSKDHTKQSAAGATTTSRKIVDETKEIPGDVHCVGVTHKSCQISETTENPIAEAIQKETEMGVDSVEDVGKSIIKTDNLYSENHLEANSGLTTSPVTEKKKTRKKSSKAATSISNAATIASREIVNEINEGNVNRVDATSESYLFSRRENLGKESEMGEKINEIVGSGKAIPSSADDIQTDSLVSYPEIQLEVSSGLTTGPDKEKQRRKKKSSKDHTNQSTGATTTSKEVLNEREKVSGRIDRVDASSEFLSHLKEKLLANNADLMQNENEMGGKFVDKVKNFGEEKIQAAGLANTPSVLVQESKTLDHIVKFTDENTSHEHEGSKEKVEIDADQDKSVKSTKKKSSRKAKTPAKEVTRVDSGAQNVDHIRAVDGEGADNVIRNVLDSLQQRTETEEILDKSRKKSKKRSRKTDSLQQMNETEPQKSFVEVKNAAQEEAPLINNPKDHDVSFTLAKDTQSNASHVKNIIEVANNPEDNNRCKQIIRDHADMGDNFGSVQNDDIVGGVNKQDQVTGGAKSKEEKKSLDLHPGRSIDGSVKPKVKKIRVQPTSSGTSHLQSKAKNDRSDTKFDNSGESVKGAVNNRKESVKKSTVKKSSKSATVKKSKVNVNSTNDDVKKSSNTVTKMNFFKDAENWNSAEEESKTTSYVSAKTPSDSSSDDDSDVTSMSRKQGNNLAGGTNRILGSFQDILRSSKSYKKAKLTASQSQPDEFDGEALDFVPDSQAN